VISAAFGSIEGSSSCILTQTLLVPDVCGALCHANLPLVSFFPSFPFPFCGLLFSYHFFLASMELDLTA